MLNLRCLKQSSAWPFISATLALAAALSTPSPTMADPISLLSEDNNIKIEGDFVSLENGVYTVQTTLGLLNIEASRVSCAGEGCPAASEDDLFDFRIAGSATVGADLVPLLISGYSETQGAAVQQSSGRDEDQTIFLALGENGTGDRVFNANLMLRGSSGGFKALINGEADISMASRVVRTSEVESARAVGLGDLNSFEQEHSIGLDGLLIVVNQNNPINNLTEDQVAQVLSGQVTNWSEVGGTDLPITVYARRLESSNHGSIEDRFLTPRSLDMTPETTILSSNQVMADTVLGDPGAIGYLAFAYRQDTKPLGLISSCGIIARPDGFSSKTGEYPLQRSLFLYSGSNELPEHAQGLIDFATSAEADALVRKSGFLDYSVSTRSLNDNIDVLRSAINATNRPSEQNLLREMFVEMSDHDRLTTTFRFRTGSSTLDNASQRDLRRLAIYLSSLPVDAEIVFAGFTDSDARIEANRALSVQRAAQLQETLVRLIGDDVLSNRSITLKGFGELNPVGCNTDFRGKQLNRRVEVWVRSSG